MAGPRISGWPAWAVIWVVGSVSTLALFLAGIASVRDSTVETGGCIVPPGSGPVPNGALCPHMTVHTVRPYETRGLVLILVGVIWGIGTMVLARRYRVVSRGRRPPVQ